MRFLVVTIGSYGDVHPFIGLAAALQRRGHEVTFVTSGLFETLAQRESLDFLPLGSGEDYLAMVKNPDLWSKRRGFKAVFSSVIERIDRLYQLVHEYISAHAETTVIGSSLALGARIAQDKLHFQMMTIHLAPAVFRSAIQPPKLPGVIVPKWLPVSWRKRIWSMGDRLYIDPFLAPPINAFRASVGLPPIRGVLDRWWNSPDCIVGMFPDWFAEPQADWWPQTTLTNFPLYDERQHEPLPGRLEDFLQSGSPPVAFTPGSAMMFGQSFFETAVEACRRTNRRAILLSRHRRHLPQNLPETIIHVDYVPFSTLLPRVAALVHHGGIGTTSQALAAATPQLIMPMSHDQFDNAHRVKSLGVGDEISLRRFKPSALARKLERLLSDPAIAPAISAAAGALSKRLAGASGIDMTCDVAESLASRHPVPLAK